MVKVKLIELPLYPFVVNVVCKFAHVVCRQTCSTRPDCMEGCCGVPSESIWPPFFKLAPSMRLLEPWRRGKLHNLITSPDMHS